MIIIDRSPIATRPSLAKRSLLSPLKISTCNIMMMMMMVKMGKTMMKMVKMMVMQKMMMACLLPFYDILLSFGDHTKFSWCHQLGELKS